MKKILLWVLSLCLATNICHASFFDLLSLGGNNDAGRWEFLIPDEIKNAPELALVTRGESIDNLIVNFFPDHTFSGSLSWDKTGSPESFYNPYTGVTTGHDGVTARITLRFNGMWGREANHPGTIILGMVCSLDIYGGLAITPMTMKREQMLCALSIVNEHGRNRTYKVLGPSTAVISAKYLGKAQGQGFGQSFCDHFGKPVDLDKMYRAGDDHGLEQAFNNYYFTLMGIKKGGWMGAVLEQQNGKLFLSDIIINSPAAKSGIPIGANILSIDKYPMSTPADMQRYLANAYIGNVVAVEYQVPGQEAKTVKIGVAGPPAANANLLGIAQLEQAQRNVQSLIGRTYRGVVSGTVYAWGAYPQQRSADITIRLLEVKVTGIQGKTYQVTTRRIYRNNTSGFQNESNGTGIVTLNDNQSAIDSVDITTGNERLHLQGNQLAYETRDPKLQGVLNFSQDGTQSKLSTAKDIADAAARLNFITGLFYEGAVAAGPAPQGANQANIPMASQTQPRTMRLGLRLKTVKIQSITSVNSYKVSLAFGVLEGVSWDDYEGDGEVVLNNDGSLARLVVNRNFGGRLTRWIGDANTLTFQDFRGGSSQPSFSTVLQRSR